MTSSSLLPLAEVRSAIDKEFRQSATNRVVRLKDALGQVLAESVLAPMNVPPYDNSAMDGYGFAHKDIALNKGFKVVAECYAGHLVDVDLGPSDCVRIFTGAPLPKGIDTVIMQENITVRDQCAFIHEKVKKGNSVRYAGEDIAKHQNVFVSGRRLSAIDLGVLASLGVDSVRVVKLPRVAVFSTGDELTPLGEPLSEGKIYDSNRIAILLSLKEMGFPTLDLGVVADDRDDIANLIEHADDNADIVMTSGGVSVGDADHTGEILASYGGLKFWRVAVKPGKPLAFGRLKHAVFFGLPGNPVSAMVTLQQIIIPQILASLGVVDETKRLVARAAANFIKVPGRTDFQRGIYKLTEQGFEVVPTGSQSSGMLSSIVKANCYVELEQDRGNVNIGETVHIILR